MTDTTPPTDPPRLSPYQIGHDSDGEKITHFPDNMYVMGHATPAVVNELNRLHTSLAAANKRADVLERAIDEMANAATDIPGYAFRKFAQMFKEGEAPEGFLAATGDEHGN